MELFRRFFPASAQGFAFSADYREVPPSPALAPFVRCFWGSERARIAGGAPSRVIPDACMDLVFEVNYTRNQVFGHFCALDDSPSLVACRRLGERIAQFGIRFYAWSAICFSDSPLSDSRTEPDGLDAYFRPIVRALIPLLWESDSLSARSERAERVLLRHLHPERLSPAIQNAIYEMATCTGRMDLSAFSQAACLGNRQLERLFRAAMGASPKLFSQLVRHQRVYQDLLFGRFNALDAVARYGYADQSHLLRDFRRFHGVLPREIQKMSHLFYTNTDKTRYAVFEEGYYDENL